MNQWWMIAGFALVLILLGIFLPSNTLTGHVVQDGTCRGLGCVELCDNDTSCSGGTVCCMTQWKSGVCDYSTNCEKIREYSLYQTLETYQDTVREQPSQIEASSRFFIPLLIVIGIIIFFVYQRKR